MDENKLKRTEKRSKSPLEQIFNVIFLASALISVISVVAIIIFVFSKGLKPFIGVDAYSFIDFITGTRWSPGKDVYGVFYMIAGSVLATIGALVFGLPIGLLTAIYLAEMAPKKIVSLIRPLIELLAGIPSVIYGAFGLGIVVPALNLISPTGQGESLLAVIVVLTIMVLPTIITLSETSLRAVPKSYREASYGLGGSKIQTIFKSVVPAARSGILSATVLGIGRAIGETMAVMMIAGNNIGGLPTSIWSKIRPLTTNIAMEMGYASGTHQDMLFSTGVILFVFIMVINLTLIKITSSLGSIKK